MATYDAVLDTELDIIGVTYNEEKPFLIQSITFSYGDMVDKDDYPDFIITRNDDGQWDYRGKKLVADGGMLAAHVDAALWYADHNLTLPARLHTALVFIYDCISGANKPSRLNDELQGLGYLNSENGLTLKGLAYCKVYSL